tara:strand:+ start:618 stop:833 length:216 start_codon:yes stop_codon:yes gene_type:complete
LELNTGKTEDTRSGKMGNKKKRVVINEGEGLTLRVDLGHWVQQELTYENVKDMLFFINKWEQNKERDKNAQ